MLVSTKFGCSISHDGKCIYSIGGIGLSGTLNNAEAYNVTENKWYQLPNMVQARFWSVAVVFQSKYLYTFCGCYDDPSEGHISNVDTTERLNIGDGIYNTTKWEQLLIKGIPQSNMYHIA